jgi:hypothetical protein
MWGLHTKTSQAQSSGKLNIFKKNRISKNGGKSCPKELWQTEQK